MSNEGRIVDNLDSLKETIANVRKAENEFAKFSQEKVDDIFKAAAIAANSVRIPLAKMAVAETASIEETAILPNMRLISDLYQYQSEYRHI